MADTPSAFARRYSSLDPMPRAWSRRIRVCAARMRQGEGGGRERNKALKRQDGRTSALTAAVTLLRREQAGGRVSPALANDEPDRATLASCLLPHQTCPPETESLARGGKWARFQEEKVTAATDGAGHPRAEPHWGRSLSVPAPPLGMACPSYLLPILSPPPPPLEAHARIPHRPPTLLLWASSPLRPRPLPGAPRGPPAISPSPYLPGSQPSPVCWLSALWPLIRCPLSTSAPYLLGPSPTRTVIFSSS